MWIKLSDWLHRMATGAVTLAALLLFLLFTALVLPGQAARADAYSGEAGSPDGSFYYSAADLYQWADAYGADGRRAFVEARFTFDLVWPLVYMFFLSTALSWVSRRAFVEESGWRRVNLVPVLGMLFDYLENASTSLVMLRYPQETPVVALLATAFTMVKWVFVNGSFALLLGVAAAGVWRWQKGREKG